MHRYNIDGVDIPFDPDWKSIAISLSGGADSALLTCLLCNLITNTDFQVHIISHDRMWKTRPWQSYDSLRVFNWLEEHYPNIKFVRHTNFIAPELEYGNIGPTLLDEYGKKVSGDNIEQRAFAEYICHKFNIPAYFNAVTKNPSNVSFKGLPERDVTREDNYHLEFMEHMGKFACHPFRFKEKDWVVKQYKKLNLMDLFNITRSCEGEFENLDYTNYIPGQEVPQCGECFWCKERMWAIEQSK